MQEIGDSALFLCHLSLAVGHLLYLGGLRLLIAFLVVMRPVKLGFKDGFIPRNALSRQFHTYVRALECICINLDVQLPTHGDWTYAPSSPMWHSLLTKQLST